MDIQASTVDDLIKMSRTQLEYISHLQQEQKFADEKIVKLHASSEALERMIEHQHHPMCVEGLGYDAVHDSGSPLAMFIQPNSQTAVDDSAAIVPASSVSATTSTAPGKTVEPQSQTVTPAGNGKLKLAEGTSAAGPSAGPSTVVEKPQKKSRTHRSKARGKTSNDQSGNGMPARPPRGSTNPAGPHQRHPNWNKPHFYSETYPVRHPFHLRPHPQWSDGSQQWQGYQPYYPGSSSRQEPYYPPQQRPTRNVQPARRSPNRPRGNQNPPRNKVPMKVAATSVYVDANEKLFRTDSSVRIVREFIVQSGTKH